jgi:hypothetical protein
MIFNNSWVTNVQSISNLFYDKIRKINHNETMVIEAPNQMLRSFVFPLTQALMRFKGAKNVKL